MDTMLDLSTAVAGTMMDVPLNIQWVFENALLNNPTREIVSRLDDGSTSRHTYESFGKRVAQLGHALVQLGVKPGDRVASFAWNTHRHLELYYAVPMIGAVLHTVNIRLFPEQVAWVLDHAGDEFIFVDASLAAACGGAIAAHRTRPITTVVMGESDAIPGALDYETLLAGKPQTFAWPNVDERAGAVLCYTSATTGDPKGVLYTHRSEFMHSVAAGLSQSLGVAQSDVVLPIVPMFHANSWGLPYLVLMVGAKLVLPGPKLDPASVMRLIDEEQVTFSAGVPTVWLPIRDVMERDDLKLPSLKRLLIGGSACPPSLFDDLERRGIAVVHAWGMTEMSPIGTTSTVTQELAAQPESVRRAEQLKQGRFAPIVAWKLLDDDGNPVARDGQTPGNLWVRGHAVTASYYKLDGAHPSFSEDGYFHTGDVCTIDEFGYLALVDRSKDLVKSGGEWISSVDLENLIMGHPAVREAAVIGVHHEKWVERPVAVVVLRDGQAVDEASLRAWIGERVAKWMIPDRILFQESIPRTGVGKFLKRELRAKYDGILSA